MAGARGEGAAQKLARKIEASLIAGTYQDNSRKTWAQFRKEYEAKIGEGMDSRTKLLVLGVLDHFERIAKPVRVATFKTDTIDGYIAKRRTEKGRRKGDVVSPATVNKELRHLRAVLKVAHEWGYLPAVPRFRMLKEPQHLPTYILPEHFAKIYQACNKARLPEGQPFSGGDWWRALLVMAYMTGWRIGELLALPKEDLDLDAGTAMTRHDDNKGDRDEKVYLHAVAIEHLKRLLSFGPTVFPWPHNERTLYDEWARIQEAAGINTVKIWQYGPTLDKTSFDMNLATQEGFDKMVKL